MPRLPQPGSDQGQWGSILNDFLLQSHTDTGTIKAGAVGAAQIASGSLSEDKLDTSVQTKMNLINYVNVATGTEARPNASLVLWIGGTVQPTNMVSSDIWFEEA